MTRRCAPPAQSGLEAILTINENVRALTLALIAGSAFLGIGCSGESPLTPTTGPSSTDPKPTDPRPTDPNGPSGPSEEKEGTLLLPSGPVPIHYQERNGIAVWQGDIDLRFADEGEGGGLQRTQSFAMGNRLAMASAGKLWLNNLV